MCGNGLKKNVKKKTARNEIKHRIQFQDLCRILIIKASMENVSQSKSIWKGASASLTLLEKYEQQWKKESKNTPFCHI